MPNPKHLIPQFYNIFNFIYIYLFLFITFKLIKLLINGILDEYVGSKFFFKISLYTQSRKESQPG